MHLGPYPLENLKRVAQVAGCKTQAPQPGLSFHRPDDPSSIVNAMQDYQAMLDATRDGAGEIRDRHHTK